MNIRPAKSRILGAAVALALAAVTSASTALAAPPRHVDLTLDTAVVASGPPTDVRLIVSPAVLVVKWGESAWADWYTVELKTSRREVGLRVTASDQAAMNRKQFLQNRIYVPIPPATAAAMKGGTYYARVCAYNRRGGACSGWTPSPGA